MAIDPKYGRVTFERGTIGDDEVVFVFRGQDELLLKVLSYYERLCQFNKAPVRHLESIDRAMDAVEAWQATNATKQPTSD